MRSGTVISYISYSKNQNLRRIYIQYICTFKINICALNKFKEATRRLIILNLNLYNLSIDLINVAMYPLLLAKDRFQTGIYLDGFTEVVLWPKCQSQYDTTGLKGKIKNITMMPLHLI